MKETKDFILLFLKNCVDKFERGFVRFRFPFENSLRKFLNVKVSYVTKQRKYITRFYDFLYTQIYFFSDSFFEDGLRYWIVGQRKRLPKKRSQVVMNIYGICYWNISALKYNANQVNFLIQFTHRIRRSDSSCSVKPIEQRPTTNNLGNSNGNEEEIIWRRLNVEMLYLENWPK